MCQIMMQAGVGTGVGIAGLRAGGGAVDKPGRTPYLQFSAGLLIATAAVSKFGT